ncbi:Glycosyl hydrolase family 81 [Tessaracoccus bendigoensis DSM 12906]|uniref:glucan endo-1,3-beta-D-glucosidase n=2 Tax=Tessaracoccus TaxID=72763 RepID=A0A1M6NAA8_9ACTN|nr:Glycosyl hydrolase family 81 [Tessaracoccus bendigoensis DSM 12906]
MGRRSFGFLVGGATAGLLTAGCTRTPDQVPPTPTGTASTLADGHVTELVGAMPTRTLKPLVMDRLADGLTPPTNRWFSGLVFGETAQPVFPMPLGFALVDGGFELWLPEVVVSDKAIIGSRGSGLKVLLEGATGAMVTGFDVASVAVELRDDSGAGLAEVRLVQGSPSVTVSALRDVTFKTDGSGFGVVGGESTGQEVSLREGEQAVWFAPPPGTDPADLADLVAPVTGTAVDWDVSDESVTTTLTYLGGPTLLVTMPHHEAGIQDASEPIGQYPNVYGNLVLRHADQLSWTSKRWEIQPTLDLSGLDDAGREKVRGLAVTDIAEVQPYPEDSYFGGKALYRDSQLLGIARQVGADDAALASRLTETLLKWAEPDGATSRETQCFVYDDVHKGMVGLEPSFGSEEFNDHHFHYGYFLHAAGTVCAEDPELADRLAPVFDLVAADIASPVDNGLFPQFRCFDVYASHSWASGTAPFADGNNQESSSEAVNAWAGLALWARARGDAELEKQAVWMHALEAEAALAYWLQPDVAEFPGFGHLVFGMGWGAKRDYATWFSPDPMAILMIQIIPAGPGATYLAANPEVIPAAVEEGLASRNFGIQYGDYGLMYSAIENGDAAAESLPQVEGIIDNAVTMTYVTAYVLSRRVG